MKEFFLLPLNRRGFYMISDESVDQMQTGLVWMYNDRKELIQVKKDNHYHGMFFEALDQEGIKYKKIDGGYKLYS